MIPETVSPKESEFDFGNKSNRIAEGPLRCSHKMRIVADDQKSPVPVGSVVVFHLSINAIIALGDPLGPINPSSTPCADALTGRRR